MMELINGNLMFKNKSFLLTGATSGIGRAVAMLLSELGASLILIGRDELKLEKTCSELINPNNHRLVKFDLKNTENVASLMKGIQADIGNISGIVYSCGISPILPLRSISYTKLDEVMRVNLYSFIEMVKIYSLREYMNNGSIVAISSTASTMPEKGQTIYSASKAALDVAVMCLSQELCNRKIRINTIRPGLIESEMTEKFSQVSGPDFLETQKSKQLLGLGKPSDIANFVAFLLSDFSSFCTGRSYYADGGRFQ